MTYVKHLKFHRKTKGTSTHDPFDFLFQTGRMVNEEHISTLPDTNYTDLEDRVLSIQDFLLEYVFDEVLLVASKILSDHQFAILKAAYLDEFTYKQVAELFGINYTGVPHSLNGIWSKKHQKFHGGSLAKLRKMLSEDTQLYDTLNDIRLINHETIDTYEQKYKQMYTYQGDPDETALL